MYEYKAFIYNVVDGDTVDAEVDLGFQITMKMRLRLFDIDAPEKFGPSKEAGMAAKAFIYDLIYGKEVIIRTEKDRSDSFGRYLATVFLGDLNINEHMVATGHAI